MPSRIGRQIPPSAIAGTGENQTVSTPTAKPPTAPIAAALVERI
jgi:hypothetical protein